MEILAIIVISTVIGEPNNAFLSVKIGNGFSRIVIVFRQDAVAVPRIVNIIFLTTNSVGTVIELVRSVFFVPGRIVANVATNPSINGL